MILVNNYLMTISQAAIKINNFSRGHPVKRIHDERQKNIIQRTKKSVGAGMLGFIFWLFETAIHRDCRKKVDQLFLDCKSYRDYLAEDIVTQLNAQSPIMKAVQPQHYKNVDSKELDIVAMKQYAEDADLDHFLKSITKYEAVDELMQKLNAEGTPYLLRLAAFQEAFGRLKPILEEHRGNKMIPSSLSFWSPKEREAAKKMEQTIAGVSTLRKK